MDLLFIFIGLALCNLYLNFKYINILETTISKNRFVLMIYFLVIAQVFEMYNLVASASRFKTTRNLFVTTVVCVLAYLYTPILTPVLPSNRIDILIFFLSIFISVFVWRNIYIFTVANKKFYKYILLICGQEDTLKDLIYHVDHHSRDHAMYGYLSEKEVDKSGKFMDVSKANLDEVILNNNIKELVVSLNGFTKENTDLLNQKLAYYFEQGINILSYEDYIERITFCVPEKNLTKYFYKYFNFSENHENRLYLFFMRCMDILAGVIGILFMLFLIPFVFIGNLIWSRGSLFYKQERVGAKGKSFKIIKFRSMVASAEKNGAQWAIKNDTRITPFGKFLRKMRIDEIPQFWNILKGEMSMIGPRPERPEFVDELGKQIPLYGIRHVIKPGLTGWAQVMYPYASTLEEQEKKLRYDLYYIKKRSLFLDFKIMIKTIHTVLYFKGQ
ncbi:exopolysaccharide biosynthesis polyprenyl glycosylphosphotransferase [Wenyingzhuangia sp. chi5]|uniref:Exopolysaccharide biosynthesis polyprenyl glycosylphosphotransferase n=1 Tax=Wenyingzhuangia gilva TaxID=3057677 RepID=A0ABT8VT54_9FLAO|nr:exopolysaccharide biosynthesis polyprenyl glycosylphosphotransferase [Wenyingzhuangia sp. chi5]MDO3695142.1 exopolysaccharide biosynthesis polyprenyl glycosylphosphotransferase [Wenyingzhuangia sp. chi5]